MPGSFSQLLLRTILLISCDLTCYGQSSLHARDDAEVDSLFEQVTKFAHDQEFDEALKAASSIHAHYPRHPAGAFALIAVYQSIMETYRVRTFEAQFDSLTDICVSLSKQAVKAAPHNGRNYFYLASAYGTRSLKHVRQGKWIDAFRDGARVKSNYERAIKYSPEFYDAYYGLGLHNFWSVEKAKVLSIFGDSRDEGIQQVILVTQKGRFLKTNSMYGLSAIYFQRNELDKCLEICEQLYQDFPNNPSLLDRMGRAYQRLENWQEAREHFHYLFQVLNTAKYQSLSFQVECLYQLARCEIKLDNPTRAKELCEQAIELDKKCDFSKEIDGPYEKYSDIRKQLNKLHEELAKN